MYSRAQTHISEKVKSDSLSELDTGLHPYWRENNTLQTSRNANTLRSTTYFTALRPVWNMITSCNHDNIHDYITWSCSHSCIMLFHVTRKKQCKMFFSIFSDQDKKKQQKTRKQLITRWRFSHFKTKNQAAKRYTDRCTAHWLTEYYSQSCLIILIYFLAIFRTGYCTSNC